MKPCRKNRKQIVMLVMKALDDSEAVELVRHLDQCDECRQYKQQISLLTQQIGAMEPLADRMPETMPALSAPKLSRVLQRTSGAPALGSLLGWHLAVPALGLIALTLLVLWALMPPRVPMRTVPLQAVTAPAEIPSANLAPTIANYRAVANRSLDELDDLLARQAQKPVAAVPSFSAATLAWVSTGD